jgi:hypothetical protein
VLANLWQGESMKKNKNIANSTLKVVASENVDISQDLESIQIKTISELLNEKKEENQVENSEKKTDQ